MTSNRIIRVLSLGRITFLSSGKQNFFEILLASTKMKTSYIALALGAITIAVTTSPLESRKVAPVNDATINLIESLEGWSATYYDINGDQTIGSTLLAASN
jgi:hypothetical protein